MTSASIFMFTKIFLAVLIITLSIIKMKAVAQYNSTKVDDPITARLLRRYSTMQIDGSYSNQRKNTLKYSNRLTTLSYMLIALLFISVFYHQILGALKLN